MKLNIELKTNIYPFPGIVKNRGVGTQKRSRKNVIFLSFYALSLEQSRQLDLEAEIGILNSRVSDCLIKREGCGANVLHPYWKGMDLSAEQVNGYPVRVWLTRHLYPEKPTGARFDLATLEEKGITDVFLNEPEMYLEKDEG